MNYRGLGLLIIGLCHPLSASASAISEAQRVGPAQGGRGDEVGRVSDSNIAPNESLKTSNRYRGIVISDENDATARPVATVLTGGGHSGGRGRGGRGGGGPSPQRGSSHHPAWPRGS